ncbi:hypothetical protein D3C85_1399960 [compost metagenome]
MSCVAHQNHYHQRSNEEDRIATDLELFPNKQPDAYSGQHNGSKHRELRVELMGFEIRILHHHFRPRQNAGDRAERPDNKAKHTGGMPLFLFKYKSNHIKNKAEN